MAKKHRIKSRKVKKKSTLRFDSVGKPRISGRFASNKQVKRYITSLKRRDITISKADKKRIERYIASLPAKKAVKKTPKSLSEYVTTEFYDRGFTPSSDIREGDSSATSVKKYPRNRGFDVKGRKRLPGSGTVHKYYNLDTNPKKLKTFMGRYRSKRKRRAFSLQLKYVDKNGEIQYRKTKAVTSKDSEKLLGYLNEMLSKYETHREISEIENVELDVWGKL